MLRSRRVVAGAIGVAMLVTASACSTSGQASPDEGVAQVDLGQQDATDLTPSADSVGIEEPIPGIEQDFGPAPDVPFGSTAPALLADLDALAGVLDGGLQPEHIQAIARHGDARVAWFLSDLLRFLRGGPLVRAVLEGFAELTGVEISEVNPWRDTTDYLLAWDIPAFDEYATYKGELFVLVEPGWAPFFEDAAPGKDSAIDWRIVSWGGVLIDDRPLGDPDVCFRGCIPALDDPKTTDAAGGDWYDDEGIVFGVSLNGEARAYQKNIMEVHEMVNDTLGGRRIGLPYCTLCGSAQAYLTDSVAAGIEVPVLRTTGLLSRSNKVMYDLNSKSVFNTFTGQAITGPLFDAGVELEQITVVTTTWGAWKQDHPNTTIVDQFGGIGRVYPLDPLRGRDDDGPIFPVGDVDGRYVANTPVIGVINANGDPVGFVVARVQMAIAAGETVEADGVRLVPQGSGFRATDLDGNELVAHQAFWFAWTQFNEGGTIWDG